ncbi:MAG: hypothetical protein WKG01_08190 [Kofleriaceae bacterium]
MQHPSMSSRGKQIAGLIAVLLVLFLPKRVRCGYPGAEDCTVKGALWTRCTMTELEPLGLYVIELVAKRDVGFAYSVDDGCR